MEAAEDIQEAVHQDGAQYILPAADAAMVAVEGVFSFQKENLKGLTQFKKHQRMMIVTHPLMLYIDLTGSGTWTAGLFALPGT